MSTESRTAPAGAPKTSEGTAAARELVRVEDLTVSFGRGRRRVEAVRGVSFTVRPGEIVAVVGESGSGKSVTARSLVGLAGDGADVRAAALTFDGVDLRGLDGRRLRALRGRRVGFVLQDALGSLDPLRRVGAEVAEPLRIHRTVPPSRVREETERLLDAAGVPDPRARAAQYPHQLSGGLRQRSLIASALAARPDLLIADEPTTALDATVQQQILRLLRARARDGTAVLLISHDLGVVGELADRVHVMKDGRFVEEGPAGRILSAPRHPYTRALVAAVPGEETRAAPEPGPVLLRAEGLVKRYRLPGRPELTAVDGVSLTVRAGETLGVVGESGSGKTTVGRMLMGVVTPDAGRVELDGRTWTERTRAERRTARRRVQMIHQYPLGSFDPRYTARQLLEEPLRAIGTPREARAARVAELLDHVDLAPDVLDRRARDLSGGQAQRLAIARAFAPDPDVVVCDEPVSALDASVQAQVLDVLVRVQERLGVAYVFVSHDLGVVRRLSHRVAVMKDGRVVESGTAERVLRAPGHPYTRALLAAVPRRPGTGRKGF
ncbi:MULTISPECIES: dipeptide ABC transporter ATP-binding protein [unclassified Streptomyces]|uniref:dipeptide ABC transporter ATP-binding protein n=1 Tax=unclassified Streptomyces TaxID=2593676 RepID=UPI0006AEBB70|nr:MULTISPECIES: ABC transporter ATP-binding protein [unclassified Streptomyces]